MTSCVTEKRIRKIRADRLVSIILILQGRGGRTCAALAEELEVSRRTILRDLEALSYAGVPIIAEGGRGGGVRLDDSYRSGLTGLGEGEIRALALGADAALASDLGMGESLRLGRLKLQAARSRGSEASLERLQKRILVDSRWWWREEGAESFLPLLQEAALSDEALDAEYERYDGSRRGGRMEPYGLVAKAGQWYLVGRREGELRSYRVSRFRSVSRTGEVFERDESFDLRAWWPANEDRFAAEFSAFRFVAAMPEEGLLQARRIAPGRVSARGPSSIRPGWIEAEIRVDSSPYAEMIVLALSPGCLVIEPDSLAEAVAGRLAGVHAILPPRDERRGSLATTGMRAAYCGLYCGACPVFLATRTDGGLAATDGTRLACDGCRSDRLPPWCAECGLKACARKKGLAFCGECSEYPCVPYAGFRDAREFPYHLDCPGYLKAIKAIGAAAWLSSMEEKYRCPACSKPISGGGGSCPSCGSPVPG